MSLPLKTKHKVTALSAPSSLSHFDNAVPQKTLRAKAPAQSLHNAAAQKTSRAKAPSQLSSDAEAKKSLHVKAATCHQQAAPVQEPGSGAKVVSIKPTHH